MIKVGSGRWGYASFSGDFLFEISLCYSCFRNLALSMQIAITLLRFFSPMFWVLTESKYCRLIDDSMVHFYRFFPCYFQASKKAIPGQNLKSAP